MASRVQLFSGPASVTAARELMLAEQARRDAWPYPHVYPPPQSEDVHVISTAAVGTAGTGVPVEVLKYTVQSGRRFFLRAVLFQCDVTVSIGAALFTLDRNASVGGTSNTQYDPEHGLVNIPMVLGSNMVCPWYLQRPRIFEPLDVVRVKALNVDLGGGNFVAGIFGWDVPVTAVRGRK